VLNLSKEESWRAISRDFALVFLNCNYPPTQAWFDEGFADYFSSLRFENKQVLIGGDPDSFTELLNTTAWLAIPDLFATSRAMPAAQESSHHTVFYAESWIVMHYLLSQNKLPETGTYFDLVENQHLSVEEAIQKAYGMSSGQLADAVKNYFHTLAQSGTAGASPLLGVAPSDQIGSSNQELPFAEGQALLAEMTVRLPEHRAQAVQQLESIIGLPKGDNVVARRALGWAEMQKKEFDSAVEEFNKGAELNPKDPWLHYYLALVRLRAAQAAGKSTEGLPNVMQDLRLVVDWDPEFVQARSMLAMAQLEGGGVHAAMDSMRATIQLAPRNQTYLLNMAQNPQSDEVSVDQPEQVPAPPQPDKRPIQFLKGKIVAVDCSHAPSAILTVSGGAKVLKLRTDNYKSLMVMGADDFSCEWKGRTVAVNYRAGGTADGDLVSVELE
jgi:cytochrome c-type biogenesis protein CcmH/NrfG